MREENSDKAKQKFTDMKNKVNETERLKRIQKAKEDYAKKVQEERAVNDAKLKDWLASNYYTVDQQGNKVEIKKLIESTAHTFSDPKMLGYQNWQSNMMEALGMAKLMAEYYGAEAHEFYFANPLIPSLQAGVRGLTDKKNIKGIDKGQFDLKIPVLEPLISCGSDNKLQVKVRVRDTGEELAGDETQLFKEGIEIWLDENEYAKDSTNIGGYRNIITNEALNDEALKNLLNDPVKGLNKFLEKSSDMPLEFKPSPR